MLPFAIAFSVLLAETSLAKTTVSLGSRAIEGFTLGSILSINPRPTKLGIARYFLVP